MPNNNQSNRPADTAFKQQKLKSWQPLLTPKNVIPIFFVIGIIFIPIGIILYLSSESVDEIILDYTNCSEGINPPVPIRQWKYDSQNHICKLSFQIFETYKKPVYLYYRLTNFYQNHRDYSKSYDAKQLKSDTPISKVSSACEPFDKTEDNKQIYPCGLIANSFFSDEISNLKSNGTYYEFKEEGISWSSDKDKYKNMNLDKLNDVQIKSLFSPPPNWKKVFPKYNGGYNRTNFPKLAEMERFQVWMRVAGLPNFRKLYGQNKNENLKEGIYDIEITDSFDVKSFGGTKSIIISNTSAFGGKNPFLGIGYIIVGSISLLIGIVFLVKNMLNPRKLGDTSYLSYKTQ
ncbi:Lem3/Cdc50 [Neocallimastix lanati (nom. inval.)]|uniref:Lem3/Cdc50 n=1 Tax=Neocallimastix californiae TaxID=1754190 RepID=A0A1Y2E045_9FUNG|nr:Lem3/Cdc50 [Neocallimastix sp. JGI-2020a]ORY64724.1 Lem3/Cdc50 [Neocallimastix californiae]|eukprot:ORY64724.1 Lem3/Cdc50 [Neocallimastix californiae]